MLAFAPFSGACTATSALLDQLATALHPVGGAAAAVVVLTVAVRLALHPLTRRAVRGERARLRLAPQLARLRERHGTDPARFATEVGTLHRAAGVSPVAGLLPTLAQAPAFLLLYRAAAGLHGAGRSLFAVALSTRLAGAAPGQWWVFGVLLAAVALVAWLSARRAVRVAAALPGPTPSGPAAGLIRWAPYLTVVSAAFVPLAAGLYVLTSAAYTLVENVALRRGLPEDAPRPAG
jgi:YidC/Oxa1 family membrane protein insertase